MARCYFLLMVTLSLLLSGCNSVDQLNKNNLPSVLQDIAYKDERTPEYRVFLDEGGEYIPYLVLSSDYNGNCLLLRENLMDENRIYNINGEKACYYENSSIDQYLNGEFLGCLSPQIQDAIPQTQIEITKKDSIEIAGKETTTICRKVFLLSFTELNDGTSRTNLAEGVPLSYFANNERRVATYKDGSAGSWWLRTPNTGGGNVVCGVSASGYVSIGGIYNAIVNDGYYNGVRPAFCLPKQTQITQRKVSDIDVFVIE